MSGDKVDTRFVVGGIYSRHFNGSTIYGMLLSSTELQHGRREGLMSSVEYGQSRVIEGTASLNEWRLHAVPVPVGKLEELQARIEALEAGPRVVVAGKVDRIDMGPSAKNSPLAALAETQARRA